MNPRVLSDHKLNLCNSYLEVTAYDPGPGGAPTRYDVVRTAPRDPDRCGPQAWATASEVGDTISLKFQNGTINSWQDVNGLTNEVLLAILIDRLRSFQFLLTEDGQFDFTQKAEFHCPDNQKALLHCVFALQALHDRTRDRQNRGVEGTHTP